MYRLTRVISYSLLTILIILEVLCFSINIIIFNKSCNYNIDSKTEKIISINILTSSMGFFINFLSIIMISIYGIHSLYFKIKFKLNLFLIFSSIVSIFIIFLLLIDLISKNIAAMKELEPVEIQNILSFKESLLILNDIKFCIYIINMIFINQQRREIIKQRTHSHFVSIDENLNKDLFENIINRSKNPRNEDLSMAYSKILDQSKIKIVEEKSQIFDKTENVFDKTENYNDDDFDKNDNDVDKTDHNINNDTNNTEEISYRNF